MDEGDPGRAVRGHLPIGAMCVPDELRDAMMCLLCSGDVRTLMISGPVGTGKSTAVRSIAGFAGGRKIIEIPQNVTREQLFGTVDIEKAITSGRRVSADSIFARADGNILIADNANLLPEGILQMIVNAVSDGMVKAEIDGISVDSACDTVLICTMDPSEGGIGRHVSDRFDMCVELGPEEDEERRREMVSLNLAYERDPRGFMSSYRDSEREAEERIAKARAADVHVTDNLIGYITKACAEMNTEGHRGDISLLNVSCALAALNGRHAPGPDDLKEAIRLCLLHRRRERKELPPPEEEEDEKEEEQPPEDSREEPPEERDESNREVPPDDGMPEHDDAEEESQGTEQEKVFAVGEAFDIRDFIPKDESIDLNGRSGKRDPSESKDGTGHSVGDRFPRGKPRDIALSASIRAAAPYQTSREHNGLAVSVKKEDLREKVRIRKKGTKLVFVVDGSGSVGSHNRMVAVKGAILSMLNDAYRRRDEVSLVVFRGDRAETVLPMTRSILTAYRCLGEIPTGGKTPLMSGLAAAYGILQMEAESGFSPAMVILTDGRGNVSLNGGTSSREEYDRVTGTLASSGIRLIVIDTETGFMRFGKASALADAMGADYMRLEDLNAERLTETVRTALRAFE